MSDFDFGFQFPLWIQSLSYSPFQKQVTDVLLDQTSLKSLLAEISFENLCLKN
jgi:hypothetical protein